MEGFSTIDGFANVNEGVIDMLKYLANEPSVGLYYVQQHTHTALPNLLHLNEKVVSKSYETMLHTEDLEDSITMVRSMKQCGLSIADDMVKEINKSLIVMSTSYPRLINNSTSASQTSRSINSWGSVAFGSGAVGNPQDGDGSAKKLRFPNPPLSEEVSATAYVSTLPDKAAAEELPFTCDGNSPPHELSLLTENYEEFKADREAKLQEWLQEE
ncbi:hypothetical protein MKX01_011516 [Papaver californicum]|nr:hypothetical protein MKX01_011516 [Papaver californicum]